MRELFCVCFLAMIVPLSSSCQVYSQEVGFNQKEEKLDTFLEQMHDRFEIPGLAVAITSTEKTIYTKAIGVRHLSSDEALRPEHIFHMASVSKPFVATAIMQLVEKGKMELNAPITRYLPYFELDDEQYRKITIQQVLTHTSGMPDENDYQWDKAQYDEGAAERYVRSLSDRKLVAGPGEQWSYSNIAFDILGDVITKVSGQSFEQYVDEHILSPLGMNASSFLINEIEQELRTSPHVGWGHLKVSEVYPYNRRHAPSSTLNSNVVEMAHWAIANLNKGQYNGARILKEESYALLWKPWVEINKGRQSGLSWFLDRYRNVVTIEHGGRDIGYTSYFTLLPEMGYGIIVTCNDYLGPVGDIRNGIIDILLGLEPVVGLPSISDAFDKMYKTKGLEAAKAQYRHLEHTAKDQYAFGWQELNVYGFFHLYALNEDTVAIDAFTFNTELYPEEAGAYISLGEGYKKVGNRVKAIESFEKALDLDPESTEIKEKIGALNEAGI